MNRPARLETVSVRLTFNTNDTLTRHHPAAMAINETVRIAHQHQDHVGIALALAWLHRVIESQSTHAHNPQALDELRRCAARCEAEGEYKPCTSKSLHRHYNSRSIAIAVKQCSFLPKVNSFINPSSVFLTCT